MKIRVRVVTRSAREEVAEQAGTYIVRVKEAPQDGRANEAVVRLLARHFRVSRSAVSITRGFTARDKTVEVKEG